MYNSKFTTFRCLHLIHVTTEMIKSFHYIYNKGIITLKRFLKLQAVARQWWYIVEIDFLNPFRLEQQSSVKPFMPWVTVNDWLCQYFPLSHKIYSMSVALLQTCSIISTDKNWKKLFPFLHIPLKCFAIPHISFFVLISLLCILKRLLKLVAEPT